MIRVSICEDALDELEYNSKVLRNVMNRLSKNMQLFCFQSCEELLFEIEVSGNMDMIFLDIEMTGMSGIEAARRIREKDSRVILIFISYHDQYCKELIDVQPFAFIDKPAAEDKLEKIMINALKTKLDPADSYHFSYRKVWYNVPLTEIRFFESDKRRILINTVHESTLTPQYMFYGRLEKVEEELAGKSVRFLRIRQSFLVNAQYITEYAADKVVLDDGMVIEISKSHKDAVRQHYLSVLKDKD